MAKTKQVRVRTILYEELERRASRLLGDVTASELLTDVLRNYLYGTSISKMEGVNEED